MLGIQREYVKERIAEYRAMFPYDKREDWVIGEALGMMINDAYISNVHLRKWQMMQVNQDQLSAEAIADYTYHRDKFRTNYRILFTRKKRKYETRNY